MWVCSFDGYVWLCGGFSFVGLRGSGVLMAIYLAEFLLAATVLVLMV